MKRKIFKSLAATGLLTCAILSASAAQQTQNAGRPCLYWNRPCYEVQAPAAPNQTTMSQAEKQAAELVNKLRAQNGLPALTIDSNLSAKARIKSNDMKTNNYFSHNSPTYGSPFQMMQSLGISYRSAGENIAKGFTSAERVVNAWMASPSHRANILSPNYTTIGVGYVDGYWTQWFIR